MYRVRSKLMDEIRVAEIRKKLNREENDDIEFLLDLVEQQERVDIESDYVDELEDKISDLQNKNDDLEDEAERLERKLKELREKTICLGDYI